MWVGEPSRASGDRPWKSYMKVGWAMWSGGLGRGLMGLAFSGCCPLEAGAWLHSGYGPSKLFEGRALRVTHLGVRAPASWARSLLTAPVAGTHQDCCWGRRKRLPTGRLVSSSLQGQLASSSEPGDTACKVSLGQGAWGEPTGQRGLFLVPHKFLSLRFIPSCT